MNFILNNLPWCWLAVTILCIIIEGFSQSLTTIWFAIGAFVLVCLSFLPIPLVWQFLIFILISLALLLFTRPFVEKKLNLKKTPTNVDSLLGKNAIVVNEISRLQKGRILVNGIEWAASSVDDSELEKGSECIIERIEGVTAFVKKAPNVEK